MMNLPLKMIKIYHKNIQLITKHFTDQKQATYLDAINDSILASITKKWLSRLTHA